MHHTFTVKNGVLWYTLIGVVEEVLFQHPCLVSIFFSKIPVECIYSHCGQIVSISSITPLCEHAPNYNFSGEKGG